MLFNKLRGFISLDMGVDLGTTSTLICVKGKGVVLNEPSVVAVEKGTNHILRNGEAIGEAALEAMADNPENAVALWPLKDGVITDFDIAGDMLCNFISRAQSRKWATKSRIVIAVPCDMSAVEKRAITVAAERVGAGKVYFIEKPVAAAIGMGLELNEDDAAMIVDIGGGTTHLAVITQQGLALAHTIRTGGDTMTAAVRAFIREHYSLIVGEVSAEKIKIQIGSAFRGAEEMAVDIKGVDATAGLPRRVMISSEEIRKALGKSVREIVGAISEALENTPKEYAEGIRSKGIILCGGSSLLRGLDRVIMDATAVPVQVVDHPTTVTAEGTARILDEIDSLSGALEGGETNG